MVQDQAVARRDVADETTEPKKDVPPEAVAKETNLADQANNADLIARRNAAPATADLPYITLTDAGQEIRPQSALPEVPQPAAGDKLPGPDPGDVSGSGKVTRDEAGRVTQVEYPGGKQRQFGYDDQGTLNRIVQPDGQIVVLKDGKWVTEQKENPNPGKDQGQASSNGPEQPEGKGGLSRKNTEVDLQNPQVLPDGTFKFEQRDGSKTSIHTDGTSTKSTNDGALIFADANNRVTSMRYDNGQWRSFTYDDQGKIASITEGDKKYTVKDGQLHDKDDKPTGIKNPVILPNGKYTTEDAQGNITTILTDRTSRVSKPDNSMQTKDANGKITQIDYANGGSQKFSYNDQGLLETITDKDGKTYTFKPTVNLPFVRLGSFQAEDGSKITGVELKPDGTLVYTRPDGRLQTDFTSGNSSTSDKSAEELRKTVERLRDDTGLFTRGENTRKTLEGLSVADRAAVDQLYKDKYGKSLTDTIKSDWKVFTGDNDERSLALLSDANLRTTALRTFSDPEQLARANAQIDDFQKRAQAQGVSREDMVKAQNAANEELLKSGKSPDELFRNFEKALTNTAPTVESLNIKYGVKYDEEQQPDGSKVRKYYVEGPDGKKLPVLDSNSDNPVEVERRLKEWRDAKAAELEKKYNIKFSKDGQKDKPLNNKEVDLRAPRIDELLALEDGLARSESSAVKFKGKPILVQFAVQHSSPYDAYVLPKGDQQRILFEPNSRNFEGLRGTVIHEWAHIAQDSVDKRDPQALERYNQERGYRKVTAKDDKGNEYDQWQLRDKDGNHYAQGPGQFPFGEWTRVDEKGRPLKKDGTVASGWKDKDVDKQSNEVMMSRAAVRPASSYFPNAGEGGAEALRAFRGDAENREELYLNNPALYESTKRFDQADLDNDPRFGRNNDGSSKYIRLPDGTIGPNNPQNQKAVSEFEAELARKKAEKDQQQQRQRNPKGGQEAASEGVSEPANQNQRDAGTATAN